VSNSIFSDLAWLPRQPEGFGRLCRDSLEGPGGIGDRLRLLAASALDENALMQLARTLEIARSRGMSLEPLIPFNLGVLSNATTRLLAPALIATAARYGIALTCMQSEFGQTGQDAVSADSTMNCAGLDAVLVALDYHGLGLRACPGDARAAVEAVADCAQRLEAICAGLRRNGKTVCILQNIARPAESVFGSLDCSLTGTIVALIDEVNRAIAKRVASSPGLLLLDVAGLASTVGLADWHDPTLWNMAKIPFRIDMLPLYADHVCRLLAAMKGMSRRCLVLDLDNTVWGGVLGDDGLEHIAVSQGDATGEAHLSVQRAALDLHHRGVVLAVASKNDQETVRRAFREHPDMLLREEHIAAFQVNWGDKATSIQAIAAELSLGVESMVLLDDNPAEREWVRKVLPRVAVPELPEDPALYARTLAAAGYFEATVFSGEDRARGGYYRDNARRAALQATMEDVDSYLRSLDMTVTFQPFDDMGRARISQLISKTNQFNLTTRRYSEADVRAIQHDAECVTLQVRLVDRFGDSGMISVVICRERDREWLIDSWLMSCRVLGRRVEHAVLQELARRARLRGVTRLVGVYKPTERNALVADHYGKLGFRLAERLPDGSTRWTLELTELREVALPLRVRSRDASQAQPGGSGTVRRPGDPTARRA
jgi:FkbH-like protein